MTHDPKQTLEHLAAQFSDMERAYTIMLDRMKAELAGLSKFCDTIAATQATCVRTRQKIEKALELLAADRDAADWWQSGEEPPEFGG